MSVAIEGTVLEFKKIFESKNELWYANPNCFGEIAGVELLADHQGKSYATTEDRLQIHAGEEALVFRAYFPEWLGEQLPQHLDQIESYLAISAGFTVKKTETILCDGVPVKVIVEAKLNEISLVETPAVDTTFARVVSEETCNDDLADDYERIRMVGRFVGIHRKMMAAENGGKIEYKHVASSYDVAANRFVRALAALH